MTAVEVDFENVERARTAHRDEFKAAEGFSLTYLPFISRAVIDALRDFPHLNATVGDGELVVHNYVNLAIAVDLDFEGLLAPVIHDADDKRLRAIAREISDLATRARTKKLSADDITGGTFTISNSGPFGTFMVIPVINQPQVAILSTDGVTRKPVVVTALDGNEAIAIHSVGMLAMSWDHRAFDGAYAAASCVRSRRSSRRGTGKPSSHDPPRPLAGHGAPTGTRTPCSTPVARPPERRLAPAAEHPPTYTLGVRADPAHVADPDRPSSGPSWCGPTGAVT